jgi:hypothetical protein
MSSKEVEKIAKMIRDLQAKQEEAAQKVKLAADELAKKQVDVLIERTTALHFIKLKSQNLNICACYSCSRCSIPAEIFDDRKPWKTPAVI